ncbi:hypothetical protein BWQ96_05924 [Gracilariopsis chorda]|uniref:Uncharacterized protein n=1 Tax=Gracilariopsis chorda TaxID=448386 RepID=A0A2V3IRG0_9FLOR|nr:hypothetical protein BWQ96_05924 [Gracilariopsis chorda]|eukprot:PXF44297.1 hypothetical protein BWQ96_05924 [Gracilariopsis chorda]
MDRQRSLNPEDTLYNCLSHFMSANAIFPPLNDSDIDVFDIVNIRATGPRGNMLEFTDVSLCDVLSPGERHELKDRIKNGEPFVNEKRLSAISNWSVDAKVAVEHILGSHGSSFAAAQGKFVDLAVVDEAKKSAGRGITRLIQQKVHKYFASLITETSLDSHIRERFLIGVITGVITGKLEAITERTSSAQMAANTTVNAANASLAGTATTVRRVGLYGRGVIGVKMVCFLVQCDVKTERYRISKAIPVIRGDEERFRISRRFLNGGRGLRNLLWISRRGSYLFAACHVTDANDQILDNETRVTFKRLTTECGTMPS